MVTFLRWAKSIALGVLNGVAKLAVLVLVLFVALVVWATIRGDGLPSNMVLALDLRAPLEDSRNTSFDFTASPLTVMDIVLALDAAERDSRVKGVVMRVGSANLSIAQAQEIGAAVAKFRKSGKFVIAHSQGFLASGLGDYLTAASANEIWMQAERALTAAGEGGGQIFLRGLLDKLNADPQIVKRADYKSAADQYMEKNMTPADRVQLTRADAVLVRRGDRGRRRGATPDARARDPPPSRRARNSPKTPVPRPDRPDRVRRRRPGRRRRARRFRRQADRHGRVFPHPQASGGIRLGPARRADPGLRRDPGWRRIRRRAVRRRRSHRRRRAVARDPRRR
ncbi:MAG: S49 family peptidase [Rhizomicrobium sp.]